jgi:hypothetical protein
MGDKLALINWLTYAQHDVAARIKLLTLHPAIRKIAVSS